MKRRGLTERELRDLLRAHDPAAGLAGMAPAERARMRRAIETAAAAHGRGAWLPGPVAAAAAVLAVVAAISLVLTLRRPPAEPATREVAGVAGERPGPVSDTKARQVQMATPGGTRIVWILDPDFKL